MGKYIDSIIGGLGTGLFVSVSAWNFIDYAIERAAVFQEYLSRAPELTGKVIYAANEAVKNIGRGELLLGLASGALAGLNAGLTLYAATKKED